MKKREQKSGHCENKEEIRKQEKEIKRETEGRICSKMSFPNAMKD